MLSPHKVTESQPSSSAQKAVDGSRNTDKGLLPIPTLSFTKPTELVESSSLFTSSSQGFNPQVPKLELFTFEGTNPRTWIRKCQKYFQLYSVQEEQKVDLATLYLGEKADIWLADGIKE